MPIRPLSDDTRNVLMAFAEFLSRNAKEIGTDNFVRAAEGFTKSDAEMWATKVNR